MIYHIPITKDCSFFGTVSPTMDSLLTSTCFLVRGFLEAEGGQKNKPGARMVPISVLCVFCLTVIFGRYFLGCNLLMKSENIITMLRKDRRLSKEAEVVVIET
uniref:Uncharacterized protein n=1 Tax=Laticauda laticaudata TaxID=8630 RepID=A0A8C5WX06_LATLA